MKLGLINRERLGTLGQFLVEELDSLVARIVGSWNIEHKPDGSHKSVNADSIVSTGDIDAGGELTATGEDEHLVGGPLSVDDDVYIGPAGNNSEAHVGVRLRTSAPSGSDATREFHLVSDNASSLGARFWAYDKSGDRDMGGWRWNNADTAYEFLPDRTTATDRTMRLGSPLSIGRQDYWPEAYVEDLYLGRGADVPAGEWADFTPSWTNLTVGNGAVSARYARIADTVHFAIRIVFGSTTSVSGQVVVSLPTAHDGTPVPKASCLAFDASAALHYSGVTLPTTSPNVLLYTGTSPLAVLNATAPFTFTTDDQISIYGTYEVP